jgi:hypothetical protein
MSENPPRQIKAAGLGFYLLAIGVGSKIQVHLLSIHVNDHLNAPFKYILHSSHSHFSLRAFTTETQYKLGWSVSMNSSLITNSRFRCQSHLAWISLSPRRLMLPIFQAVNLTKNLSSPIGRSCGPSRKIKAQFMCSRKIAYQCIDLICENEFHAVPDESAEPRNR